MVNKSNLVQKFMDSSGAIIYIKDEEGRFIMVNHAYEETFKMSEEQVLGKNDYDFLPKGS